MNPISFFRSADQLCDRLPGVSTVSNLIDLFQKAVLLPVMSRCAPSILKNHYYEHINQKSPLRCVALLLPVIGNFLVWIYDFVHAKLDDDKWVVEMIRKNPLDLEFVSQRLRKDSFIVGVAADLNVKALEWADGSLRSDRDFMLDRIKKHPSAIKWADPKLIAQEQFKLDAVEQNCSVVYIDPENWLQNQKVALLYFTLLKQSFLHKEQTFSNYCEAVELVQSMFEYFNDETRQDQEITRGIGFFLRSRDTGEFFEEYTRSCEEEPLVLTFVKQLEEKLQIKEDSSETFEEALDDTDFDEGQGFQARLFKFRQSIQALTEKKAAVIKKGSQGAFHGVKSQLDRGFDWLRESLGQESDPKPPVSQ